MTFNFQRFLIFLSLLFTSVFCAVVTPSGRFAGRPIKDHDNLLTL